MRYTIHYKVIYMHTHNHNENISSLVSSPCSCYLPDPFKTSILTSMTYHLPQDHTSSSFPDRSLNWKPSIHIYELVGDNSFKPPHCLFFSAAVLYASHV